MTSNVTSAHMSETDTESNLQLRNTEKYKSREKVEKEKKRKVQSIDISVLCNCFLRALCG